MKKLIIIFASILLLSASFSCRKVIDIELKDSERKIVINSFFNPQENIKLNISQSLGILDSKEVKYLDNAIIEIYENNTLVDLITNSSNGNYVSTVFPKINSKYSVYVSYEGLKKAYSENIVPNPINIISIDTSTVYTNNSGEFGGGGPESNEQYLIKIKFQDIYSVENYYVLSLSSIQKYVDYLQNGQEIIKYDEYPLYFSSNDLILQNVNYGNQAIFSDELIDGKEYELKILIDKYNFYNDTNIVTVFLKSISKEYYLYNKSMQNHLNVKGDPFSEPVQVYNNIINGFGVFAAYSQDTIKINFPISQNQGYYIE